MRYTFAKWSVRGLIVLIGASVLVLEISRAALKMAVRWL